MIGSVKMNSAVHALSWTTAAGTGAGAHLMTLVADSSVGGTWASSGV
jgi:hypothetical protein